MSPDRRRVLFAGAEGLAFLGLGGAVTAAPPDPDPDFHIFALMGKSNMAGYGAVLAGDRALREGIVHIPTVATDGLTWQPSGHPLHNRLASDQFSLGIVFADYYLHYHPGTRVGLLPLAWGGAMISQLHKGSQTYTDFLDRLAVATAEGSFRGVLWHQGESDAIFAEHTPLYQSRLDQLVDDVRLDAGDPDLPFIVGDLSTAWTGSTHEAQYPGTTQRVVAIRAVLKGLPERKHATRWVSSDGAAATTGDPIHVNRAGSVTLGLRYLEAYNLLAE